jgi:hypothetical protein
VKRYFTRSFDGFIEIVPVSMAFLRHVSVTE